MHIGRGVFELQDSTLSDKAYLQHKGYLDIDIAIL